MERSTTCESVYTNPTGIAPRLFGCGLPRGFLHRGVGRRLRGVLRVRAGTGPIGVFLRLGLGLDRLLVLAVLDVLRCERPVRFLLTRLRPVLVIRAFLTIGRRRRVGSLEPVLRGLTTFTALDLVMAYEAFFRG